MSMYRRPSCPTEARRSRRRFRQLVVESLETRSLLAADFLSGDLLYAGIADSSGSSTNPGLLMLVDVVSGSVAPWHAPFSSPENSFAAGEGVSGLAFSPAGKLFGAISGGPASRVAEFDPATGQPVRPPVTIRAGTQLLNIFDLAAGPGSAFQLYGIGAPAAAGAGQIQLYLIDPGTGQATTVPGGPAWLSQLARAEGLAFGPGGTLYITGLDAANGNPKLYVGDPQNWQTQPAVRSLSERVVGLDVRTVQNLAGPVTVTLVGPIQTSSNSTTGALMEINPDTGAFIRRLDQDLPTRGVAGDVAFYPEPESLTLRIEHEQDFEQGNGGYWADNRGGTIPGMWHYSTGRRSDRLINHTPIRNWYYGQFETSIGGGTYLTSYDHQGVLNSPPIRIPECATTALSFSYLLGTRESPAVDFVEVRIQYVDDAGRTQTDVVLSRAVGTLPQTGNRWLTATADLSLFAGREVVVQFSFDTGDAPLVDPEGWYVDDVVVASVPQAVCGFKWQDENHDGVWNEGEPGLNGWTIYADTDGSGTFNPAQDEQTFYGAVDASGFAAGKQVRDARRTAALSLSATGAPIWAMPNPATPAGKVLAWGTAAGEEIWQLGRVLRVEFEPGVHTVSLDFAAVGPAPNARTVLEAFDRNHNRIGERSLVQSDTSWQTLTVTAGDNEIAYVKATVDYGSVRLNNLQYWGTTPATAGDPWALTRSDGGRAGAFSFDRLPLGTYAIREVLPEGWKQTYPGALDFGHPVTIAAGQSVVGHWETSESPNFGNFFRPAISGYKWYDVDGDGVWEKGENDGLDNWTIELYLDVDRNGELGLGDRLVGVQQTAYDGDHHGAFWFADVPPGNYLLRELLQDDWLQSYPTVPTTVHAIEVVANQHLNGRWQVTQPPNLGNAIRPVIDVEKLVSVDGGVMWDDANSPSGPSLTKGTNPQFKFVVTNAGMVNLTNLKLTDPSVDGFVPLPPANLLPGDSFITFASGAWQAGQQMNTAVASGSHGTTTASDSDVAFYFGADPGIALTKAGTFTDDNGNGRADVGELIQYEFTVSNTGNLPLTNVSVTDPDVQIVCPGGNPIPTLAPGDSKTCTGPYAITTADIAARKKDNTATADSDQTAPVTATATVTLPVPMLVLAKSGTFTDDNGNGRADVGELIQYEFTVSNTGNVPLTNVSVTDPDVQIVCPGGNPIPTLAPGDSQICTGSYAITTADIAARKKDNTATADSDQTDPVTASATVTLPVPVLVLAKSGTFTDDNGNGRADAGELIQYTFTVSNTGNVPLTNVSVTDPDVLIVCPGGNPMPTLAPGDSQICTGAYAITAADIAARKKDNTATADSDQTDPVTASATVTLPVPVLVLAKSGMFTDDNGNGRADVGELIQYEFTVSNTGNLPLTNVSVTDPDVQIVCPGGNPIPTLAPGDSKTCTGPYAITTADIAARKKDNTATADSDQTAPVTASATVTLPVPMLVLAKSGTFTDDNGNGQADVGELIQYEFTVSNTGNVPLTNVSVADPDVLIVCPGGNPIPTLAPGDSQICTGAYAITAADIAARKKDNTATADSDQTAPVTATATVALPVPVLVLAKSGTFTDDNGNGRADVGELIQYEFTVSNAGNVPLTNVSVADPDVQIVCPGGNPIPTLAPGDSQICTGSYAVTMADIAARKKDNTATADSDQTAPVTATATVTLPVPPDQPQVIQFITPMSVYRTDGPFVRPPDSQIGIAGYVWDDRNGNRVWDADEPGLDGWTVYVDLNQDSQWGAGEPAFATTFDGSHHGAFWFKWQDLGLDPTDATKTTGIFTVRQVLPSDLTQKYPSGNSGHTVTVDLADLGASTRESLGVYGVAQKPNFGNSTDNLSEKGSIQGYLWHDVNQNGAWDTGEPGRAGWLIFLDLNGNNLYDAFDPAEPSQPPEPFAVTGADGSYVFADLQPGIYTIRVDRGGVSDGTFLVQRFPGPDPEGLRDDDEYLVDLQAGESLRGVSGVAKTPNFGTFEYSPLVRPADDQYGHLSIASSASRDILLAALDPWQSFRVSNTTGSAFRITAINKDIDTSQIAVASQFVTVYRKQLDGTLVPFAPSEVASGETVQFFAFYDPAIRNGDQVLEQYPDWFGAKSQTNPVHTFAQGDHLNVITDVGKSFRFDLVGGSTYDSDIFYDGAVDFGDLRRLDDLLILKTIAGKLYIPDGDPLFDSTSDINARCPNEAAGVQATCIWPLQGSPLREIGLGDFSPLNVENDRARAPFLDLDADNSSGARGTGYATMFQGVPVRIADVDAQFANRLVRVLQSLSLTITNASDGDQLNVDKSKLPAGITTTGNGTAQLTLAGNATVDEYAAALRWITFSNSSSNLMARTVEIDIQAKGSFSAGSGRAFTRLVDDRELDGNIATARIIISSASFASWLNLANRYDVNGDQIVAPSDVLLIVNYLNAFPDSARLPPRSAGSYPFYDVNGDGLCTPLDALSVINYLAVSQLASGEGEAAELVAETPPDGGSLNGVAAPAASPRTFPAAAASRIAVDVEQDAGSSDDPVQNTVLPGAGLFESPAVRHAPTIPRARWTPDAEEDLAGLDRAMFDDEGLLSDLAEDVAAVRF